MIELLKSQLEASNATNLQLRLTVDTLNATISDLRATIANLESLLQERDSSLGKARNQMRGMSKLIGRKSEKQQPEAVAAMTAEEKAAEEDRRAADRKARGNNGARRKMRFEMETVEKGCLSGRDGGPHTVQHQGHNPLQDDTAAVYQGNPAYTYCKIRRDADKRQSSIGPSAELQL